MTKTTTIKISDNEERVDVLAVDGTVKGSVDITTDIRNNGKIQKVFSVDTGTMPLAKVKKVLEDLQRDYRQR